MRKIQVTAIWETDEEDETVSRLGLASLADEIKNDLDELMNPPPPDVALLENLRVDCQLMPRTVQVGSLEVPVIEDDSIPRDKLTFANRPRVTDQPYVFPEDHPLATIERAYCDTDGDMLAVQAAMENAVYSYGAKHIGRGD